MQLYFERVADYSGGVGDKPEEQRPGKWLLHR